MSEIWWWQHHNLGMFSAKGSDSISVIDGRTNATAYHNILEANLMISIVNLEIPPGCIFRQDDDPKHHAKTMKKWLAENKVNIL